MLLDVGHGLLADAVERQQRLIGETLRLAINMQFNLDTAAQILCELLKRARQREELSRRIEAPDGAAHFVEGIAYQAPRVVERTICYFHIHTAERKCLFELHVDNGEEV